MMRSTEGQKGLWRFALITASANFEVGLSAEYPQAPTCSLKVRDIYFSCSQNSVNKNPSDVH